MNQERPSDVPYSVSDAGCLVFRNGRGVVNFDSRRDAINAASLANRSHAEGRKAAENYTEKMLVCAKDEVRKCHEEIRRLEDKYARNVYKMPGSLENELEEKKVVKDALLCGTGFMKDGKRVPPEDVYLSEAEIKLKKAEKDLKELLNLANGLVDGYRARCEDHYRDPIVADQFDAWKKARGIE